MDDFDLKPAKDLGLNPWARLSSVRRESGPFLGAVHTAWGLVGRVYFALWHRLRVIGREHLPADPPFVLCSNHASHLDASALADPLPLGIRDRVFALAAGDVFFESTVATAFAAGFINAVPVWRKKRTPKALQELREKLLHTPCGFILFPEGGRTRDGNPLGFKPGVGMLVAGTSVPVIPCHLSGTFAALPAGVKVPRPERITVRVGPPVSFAHVPDDRRGWVTVGRAIEERILALAPGGPLKAGLPAGEGWPGGGY